MLTDRDLTGKSPFDIAIEYSNGPVIDFFQKLNSSQVNEHCIIVPSSPMSKSPKSPKSPRSLGGIFGRMRRGSQERKFQVDGRGGHGSFEINLVHTLVLQEEKMVTSPLQDIDYGKGYMEFAREFLQNEHKFNTSM